MTTTKSFPIITKKDLVFAVAIVCVMWSALSFLLYFFTLPQTTEVFNISENSIAKLQQKRTSFFSE